MHIRNVSNKKHKRHPKWTNSTISRQLNCGYDKYWDPPTTKKSKHTQKKAQIFDGLHSDSLISLGQMCDDDCTTILYNNEINMIKHKKIILKGHINKTEVLWEILISIPLRHRAHTIITRNKTKTELIQYLHGY